METLALFLLAGVVAGLSASLFGLGGGVALVPILFVALPLVGIAQDLAMHMAVGTSLAVMVVTGLDSLYNHHRKGDVLWPEVRKIAPFVALGALAAALGARWVPPHLLHWLFVALLVFVIARALLKKGFADAHELKDFEPTGRGQAALFGLANGMLSGLVGTGGGVFTVPFLRHRKLPMVNAVSVSSGLSAPIALCGSLGYVISGWDKPGLPEGATGYVYWPAMAGLAVGTLIAVPIGTRLSHHLSDRLEARLYLLFICGALVAMLV